MHLLHKMSFVGGGNIFKSYILSASTFELCLESLPPPPFFFGCSIECGYRQVFITDIQTEMTKNVD